MDKSDWYSIPDHETSSYSVEDSDWNEWVIMVSATLYFHFEMSVVFDEGTRDVDGITIDVSMADRVSAENLCFLCFLCPVMIPTHKSTPRVYWH